MFSQTTLFYLETLQFYQATSKLSNSNDEAVLRTVAYVLADYAVCGSDFDEAAAEDAIAILNKSVG